MYLPPFALFSNEFLLIKKKENDLLWNYFTNGKFHQFSSKTQQKIKQGDIPEGKDTEKRLLAVIEKGQQLLTFLRKRISKFNFLFPHRNEKISWIEIDKYLRENIAEGFQLSNSLNLSEFQNTFQHIERQTILSTDYCLALKKGDTAKANEIYRNRPLFPAYWDSIDNEAIIQAEGNHPHLTLLLFRGFLYHLALIEAFFLTTYPEDTPSQIIYYLLDAPYCKDACKPLQRFFHGTTYDIETGQYLSINDIGRLIGKRHLDIEIAKGKHKKLLNDKDPLIAKTALTGLIEEKDNTWTSDFVRDLSLTKISKGLRVPRIYPVDKAKFYLEEVRLQNRDPKTYPYDLFWLTFFAARAFHHLWAVCEIKKDESPILDEILPNGVTGLMEFYRPAFDYAGKVVAGEVE